MSRLIIAVLLAFLAILVISVETQGAVVAFDGTHPVLSVQKEVDELFENNFEKKSCAKIGELCYTSDECCSKRCLSYWAKCVT